jgi:EAL domain-containing protein (putative c-di-GMP-specific phosphodiesterase class I)/FixJ family two-component response regulator
MLKADTRVLVLDDEPFMLGLLSQLLGVLGFVQVATSDNGRDALLRIEHEPHPHLILLDLNMPDMDGAEFVRRLVEHDYAGMLVLVSGEQERVLHMAEKLFRAHRLDVIGHLAKPFTLEGLTAIMNEAVEHPTVKKSLSCKSYPADALAAAIAGGQLTNHYQPVVDVRTAAVVCVETLVRWQHPQDGLVMPDQFVGQVEEHGLIDQLTHAVVRDAFAQMQRWRQAGINVRVAINVSMDNLASIDFAERVSQAAIDAGVAPRDVMLEVTESRLMLDQRAPLEVLTRLRMKRFGLAVDDFGTGHSSLSQLRDIPFDELKIDRSFVHGAWKDPTARAIYDASLALGKQLGMVVVAEGVEDADDWDLLQKTRCDLAQGYFIGRPMVAEALPEWIEQWRLRMPAEGEDSALAS